MADTALSATAGSAAVAAGAHVWIRAAALIVLPVAAQRPVRVCRTQARHAARGIRGAEHTRGEAVLPGSPWRQRRLYLQGMSSVPPTAATPLLVSLYAEAFRRYAVHALWSMRPVPEPGPEDALVVARALRIEGDMAARALAERIEEACRAAQ